MSYIIKDNEIIAKTKQYIKSGTIVRFGYCVCDENIDRNRDYNLVNSKVGKISNAKKWDKMSELMHCASIDYSKNCGEDAYLIVGETFKF